MQQRHVYVSDPINEVDLDGRKCARWVKTASTFLSYSWVLRAGYHILQGDGRSAVRATIGGGQAVGATTGVGYAAERASRPIGRHSKTGIGKIVGRLAGRGTRLQPARRCPCGCRRDRCGLELQWN